MIIKNLKKYFSFEVQVLDDKNVRRRFRASNYQVGRRARTYADTRSAARVWVAGCVWKGAWRDGAPRRRRKEGPGLTSSPARVHSAQSTTRVKPFICTMPMRLDDGWNQIQFNLSDFTRRAYGARLAGRGAGTHVRRGSARAHGR